MSASHCCVQAPARQRLYKGNQELDDAKSLVELRIETDDELGLALQQEDGSWEAVEIISIESEAKE